MLVEQKNEPIWDRILYQIQLMSQQKDYNVKENCIPSDSIEPFKKWLQSLCLDSGITWPDKFQSYSFCQSDGNDKITLSDLLAPPTKEVASPPVTSIYSNDKINTETCLTEPVYFEDTDHSNQQGGGD